MPAKNRKYAYGNSNPDRSTTIITPIGKPPKCPDCNRIFKPNKSRDFLECPKCGRSNLPINDEE